MARRPREVIEYRLYELPLHFPLILLDGEIWRISDLKRDRLHFHNCLELGICHSDSGTLVVRDEAMPFREGDITLIPRHVPHTTYSEKGSQSLWSYIFVDLGELLSDKMRLADDLNTPNQLSPYLMSRADYPKVHFFLTCILDELRGEKPGYRDVVKGLFIALYYEFTRIRDEKSEPKPSVNKKDTLAITPALEYINVGYMNKTTIDELAAMCHLSATHFRRLFLSIMGTSPLAFINAMRIDKACILLKTTEAPILEIAAEVGFMSLSSFNRAFTAIMKTSPRGYRNEEDVDKIKPQHKYILTYSGWVEPEK
jgi:AraC-type DNA-binding domain-containing proteins